jgi:hypothetical protein
MPQVAYIPTEFTAEATHGASGKSAVVPFQIKLYPHSAEFGSAF